MPAGHKDGDAYNIIYKLFTHAIVVERETEYLFFCISYDMFICRKEVIGCIGLITLF